MTPASGALLYQEDLTRSSLSSRPVGGETAGKTTGPGSAGLKKPDCLRGSTGSFWRGRDTRKVSLAGGCPANAVFSFLNPRGQIQLGPSGTRGRGALVGKIKTT